MNKLSATIKKIFAIVGLLQW